MYHRMRACLFGFYEQAERYRLDSEIILTEWNPPEDRPPIKEAYPWPRESKHCTIRIVVVPPSVHRRYEDWEKIPVHNDVAENVAIRRAKGKFILATNIDILFSNELVQYLASRPLNEGLLYAINCYGVKPKASHFESQDERLSYCRENTTWAHPFKDGEPFPDITGVPGVHTGQANFFLINREYWERVRGYPEMDMVASWTDSVLAYMFYFADARQRFLQEPMRIYHIDHGSRRMAPESNLLTRSGLRYVLPQKWLGAVRSLVRKFYPCKNEITRSGMAAEMSFERLKNILRELMDQRRHFALNDESWGLGNEDLEEFVVTQSNGVSA